MDEAELLAKTDELLNTSRTAVLTTVDAEGHPQARWMTPLRLKGRPRALYALTRRAAAKVAQLEADPRVEWLVQTPHLDEVITLWGKARLVQNPALQSEVLEALGRRLVAFWKVDPKDRDLIVLETLLEGGCHYRPMRGETCTILMNQ